MQEKIFAILFDKNEITWQTMLYEAMKSEQMDPWDINISQLAEQFLGMLKTLKEMDFHMSGKVLLAAAILLKMKSTRLIGEDIDELDRLMAGSEQEFQEFYDELGEYPDAQGQQMDNEPLIPHTPQPRKRKVSIYDLMSALEQALEVKQRRVLRSIPPMKLELPVKRVDISIIITQVYDRIMNLLSANQKRLTFEDLIPSNSRQDKVFTFIPLLHLSHVDQRKIDLLQEKPFGEIEIVLHKKDV